MKRSIVLILTGIALLVMFGCGGGSGTVAKPSTMQEVFKPDSYDLPDDSGAYVFTYGTAEKVAEGASVTSAKSKAMLDAAMYVEVYVKGLMKDFEQEAGTENPQVLALTEQCSKSVAKATFNGMTYPIVKTFKDSETGKYKTFVRCAIPSVQVKKQTHDFVRSEEAMYNEFKATQSFKELEEDIKTYE